VTLAPDLRAVVESARRATLATIDADGRPRLVPICFVVIGEVVWSPIDEKPKSVYDPGSLARVRDIAVRPEVALLADRWSEDWSALAWVRLAGRASLVKPGETPGDVIDALRAKYPQYRDQRLEDRPTLRIEIESTSSWRAAPATD
jgi:PPOX class probable F420-dependent enzyme